MKLDVPLLFLIGYRGVGKSSVGRMLAARLDWGFIDADEALERRHGRSIRDIFSNEGEESFRDKEEFELTSLCERRQHVIATGGGIVLRECNRRRLREHGRVIWLTADVETIATRLKTDSSNAERRPDLTVGGKSEIIENLKLREPWYRICADVTIPTVDRSIEEIVEDVLGSFRSSPGKMATDQA
jgi:shikimate kinase